MRGSNDRPLSAPRSSPPIGRDFAAPHRSIASLPITANLVTELAQAHLRACVLYQNELSNSLRKQEGEEARRQERMRIWGYSL